MDLIKYFKYLLIGFLLFSLNSWSEESFREIAKVKWNSLFKRDKGVNLPSLKRKKTIRRKKINLRDVKPPSSSYLYYSKGTDEAELESIQNEEIQYLFRLLKKREDPELFLRLGNIYVEKARFISFKIQSDYEKKLSDFKQGVRKTKPVLNLKTAVRYNRKSLKLFQKFKTRYPKHSRIDEVLFFLGSNSYQLGLETQGAKYFRELLIKFPRSPYVYESQFQLGEFYYTKRQWRKSYSYYLKVAKKKRKKFYFFALYKLAWTHYKMGKVLRGLGYLSRIIRESSSRTGIASNPNTFTFSTEAEEDLVLFYTYSRKNPAQAKGYFNNLLGEEKAINRLKKLAYSYRDIGNVKGVILLFNYLIENNPKHPEAFEYKYQQVQTLYELGNVKQIRQSVSEWVKDYNTKSLWAQANADRESLIKKAYTLIEVTLRDYALGNHQSYRKTKSVRSKQLALYFYRAYFKEFQKDQMAFFYAEILFDSKKYRDAIQKYEEVIRDYPSSKYAILSYKHQILALDKILPNEQSIKTMVGKSEAPIEFPVNIKRFFKSSDRYLKKFPNEKNTASILYRVAVLHYNFNHLEESAKKFKEFAEKYPSSPFMNSVGSVLLDIYNKNKDYKSLTKLANQFIQNKNIGKNLIREAQFILQQLSFKQAQDLAVKKQFKKSAIMYENFAKKNPSSALAAVAYFNAGLNYEKFKDLEQAMKMYSTVLLYKSKKHAKIRMKSSEFLPVIHERLCFYKKAAQGYASYARRFPQSPQAVNYWYNAGVIYDALGKQEALNAYNSYYRLNKTEARTEALYLQAAFYEKSKRWSQAIAYYKRYVRSNSSNSSSLVKSTFKIAEIYKRRLKQKSTSIYWYKETIALHKRVRAGIPYAAQAHFNLVYNSYKTFKAVRIPVQAQAQKRAVEKKKILLRQLEDKLKPVIRYNDGEQIIASLSLIGLANQNMAEAIYKTPLPRGLNKQGRAEYRKGIKKIITPYLKYAAQSYELALDKSKKLQVYSDWVSVATRGLSSFVIHEGEFKKFKLTAVEKELFPFQMVDDVGTATAGFLDKLNAKVKYKLSEKDLSDIAFVVKSRKESQVLKVVSRILNKHPEHSLVINSLAVFYINNRKPSLGALILNRLKKQRNPSILNNLGIVSLRQGNLREAVSYFKKALDSSPSHAISQINLGTVFIQHKDFYNAYIYLKKAYDNVFDQWGLENTNTVNLLNNYGVALASLKRWNSALNVFTKLSKQPSPSSKVLLNKAIVLAEGFTDQKSRNEVQSLVNELALSSNSVRFKKKLDKILKMMKEK